MKCPLCNTEMFVDHTETDENRETFVYKCRNPNCRNFGYKKSADPAEKEDIE